MGRHRLTVLSGWLDCERCDRHVHRLGVVAADWGRRPTVLVLALRPHRVSQGLLAQPPRAKAFAMELAQALQVDPAEIVVDTLLACGLGHEAASDHVAACNARFVENAKTYGTPAVVLVVGAHAQVAAMGAGLIDGRNWAPIGASPCPAIEAPSWSVTRDLVYAVEQALGRRPKQRRWPKEDIATAERLFGAFGAADGSASKELDAANWKRRVASRLTPARVAQHLRGIRYWAPFRPRGPWPFVVIDADRHDALQELHFADTMKMLRKLFPTSFFVESSTTGGVHVYVRLPPDTSYDVAASWLEAFFAMKTQMVLEKKVARSGGRPAVLRSARLEVPRHPVRLPFGRGSSIIKAKNKPKVGSGHNQRILAMVDEFIDWLAAAPTTDYSRAKDLVEQHVGRTGAWNQEKKKFLERQIEAAQVAGLKALALDPLDPWTKILPQLVDPSLRIIAARGVPAMGMRSRYTARLVDALFDLVPPDEAEALMVHWLQNRQHNSEDIETDLFSVEAALKKTIEATKKTVHGVPVRVWEAVERGFGTASSILATAARPGWMLPPKNAKLLRPLLAPGTVSELQTRHALVRKTAFFVVRGFFDRRPRKTDGMDGERPIPRREFSRFLPNEMQAAVKEFLILGGWLKVSACPVKGKSARNFKLAEDLWPAIPGEPVLFVPSP